MLRQKINDTIYINDSKTTIDVSEFRKKKLLIINVSQITCEETNNYLLYIICLDDNGNKYSYNVGGIVPFFDIEYNKIVEVELKKNEKMLATNAIINRNSLGNMTFEGVKLKPFNYYSQDPVMHIRFNFKNIMNYKMVHNVFNKNEKLNEFIRQNENYNNYYNKAIQYNKLINAEKLPNKMLLMTWDIETYSYDKTRIPDGSIESDDCFLICGTFHNYNSDEIISSFAISTIKTETNVTSNRLLLVKTINKVVNSNLNTKDKNIKNNIYDKILQYLGIINFPNLTIKICNNEKESIIYFMKMLKEIKPDIITGFNDHSYDWVYIKNKIDNYYHDLKREFYECMNDSKYYTLTNDIIPFTTTTTKISADIQPQDVIYPKSNFTIFIDTRVEYRKIYSKDIESNLNYFLKKMKLNLKEDMPYKKLFQIYENKDEIGMLSATLYCLTDAYRCQELLVKKQIINEHYNMAFMTGITLKNSINRANGFKVFNYLLKDGITQDYSFIYNKFEKEEKNYAGGYVADPVYGLNLDCPVIGLDFASLYPNIQRTLNLGPDTIIRDFEIEKYKNSTVPIQKICDRYVVDHNEKEELKSIMVKILTNLFNQRIKIKNLMIMYKTDKEKYSYVNKYKQYICLGLLRNKLNNKTVNIIIFDFLGIDVLQDIINDLDQKQKAIKVLMNSFYGLLGSPTSPLYCKYIAETITTMGRKMLLQVRDYVKEKNQYDIYYSDTDSVYVSLKKSYFNDIEIKFVNDEIDAKQLFTEKINITKDKIKLLLNDVNHYLKDIYVYSYIKMAYEEVLYPVFFIAKKMYFGIEHMETINYDDIDNYLFMRGCSPIRRTTTELTKNIFVDTIIKKLFSLQTFSDYHKTNNIDIFQILKNIVYDITLKFNNNEYPLNYFIKNDRYSPGKKNIRINMFVDKLTQRHSSLTNDDLKRKYTPPEPYERFKYIYVNKVNKIMFNGVINKNNGLGNIMEYPCYLDDYNAEICYNKYFESDLANDLGRLIHPKDGKKYMMKLFELFHDNINNNFELQKIKDIDYNLLINYKNEKKIQKNKQVKNDAKTKSLEFNRIKEGLFADFPLLFKYDIITNPYTFIQNINNNISKINFDNINQHKSDIYNKCYNNKYYKPILCDLSKSIFIRNNILYEELNNNIIIYCDIIYNDLNMKIEEHCNNKETIVDFDTNISFDNIIEYINTHKNFLDNIECITTQYHDIVFKQKKIESYSDFINKLKKQ